MCAPRPLNLSSVQLPVKERITGAFRPWKMVCVHVMESLSQDVWRV